MEGLGTLGRLWFEGLLLFVSSGLIYHLEDGGEVFNEFFGFLFDNTSACYLVFAFFFPTLLAFILLLCFIEYGLE